jgi:hypothetical protein
LSANVPIQDAARGGPSRSNAAREVLDETAELVDGEEAIARVRAA